MKPRRITPFEALIPEAFVVLGVRLQPFTLGHAALLMRLGGGNWIDGGECGLGDLLLGLVICSSDSFEGFTAGIYSGEFDKRIAELADTVKVGSVTKEVELFARYIQEGTEGPTLLTDGEVGTELRSPWIQILRVQLMRYLRVPASEVMDVPVSVALWDLATFSEMSQTAKLWTEKDDELQKEADAFHERIMARRNGGLTHG